MKQFNVTVHPVIFVFHCAVMADEERDGLFGFHDYLDCEDCVLQSDGFELWGENSHLQGSAKSQEGVDHIVALRRMTAKTGSTIYYVSGLSK